MGDSIEVFAGHMRPSGAFVGHTEPILSHDLLAPLEHFGSIYSAMRFAASPLTALASAA